MQLPSRIKITRVATFLDGGTIEIIAKTDTGENCVIRLNQMTFNSYKNPGRLIFNDKMVDIRSKDETNIMNLLQAATFDLGVPIDESFGYEYSRKLVQNVTTFVNSEEYIEIANNGVPEREQMDKDQLDEFIKRLMTRNDPL